MDDRNPETREPEDAASRPSLGLAMLAWHSLTTLRNTIEPLRALPEDLFDDRLIFFQEMTDEERLLAERSGFRAEGNERNQGIQEGMRQAIRRCRADVVLYLECDFLLVETADEAVRQLRRAAAFIRSGDVRVVRMLHTVKIDPHCVGVRKYARYWPDEADPLPVRTSAAIRRALRPVKAGRLIGHAVKVEKDAASRFPRHVQRPDESMYLLTSRNVNWCNQAIMVDKAWFLETLLPYAEAHPCNRTTNGHPNLERELNCRWWRRSNTPIGQSVPGLFVHYRVDRPEGDEMTLLHGRAEATAAGVGEPARTNPQ